ncbi:MAG: UDP-3-O-(3-hydroxymyristoyl)glucosamine N-acyltransferase [Phycisphaerales bacterium]|nr:UDP-3-O-(3-hydroxymyristoyl)glucosamine N-acyltransferase [Phycisphaerales bacterium]
MNQTAEQGVSISAGDLAGLVGGRLVGDPSVVLNTIAGIDEGTEGALTFIRAQPFADRWAGSACSAALVTEGIDVPDHDPASRALIFVTNADHALVRVLRAIDPGHALPPAGIHQLAVVDPTAEIHPTARIGPGCVVGAGTSIGANSTLIASVFVGSACSIGNDTIVHPNATISDRVRVGSRCVIFSGSVLGADGFGFIPATTTTHAIKIPQIGTVAIGDDVEIGACCTVDRAKLGATTVGNHVKLDDHVHIGHNCIVEDDVVICGCTAVGGSVTIGKGTLIGGAVVISDQATIGSYAKIAGGAMVLDRVPANETYAGIPAMPARTALANHGAMRSLASFMRSTEKTLKKLTENCPENNDSR